VGYVGYIDHVPNQQLYAHLSTCQADMQHIWYFVHKSVLWSSEVGQIVHASGVQYEHRGCLQIVHLDEHRLDIQQQSPDMHISLYPLATELDLLHISSMFSANRAVLSVATCIALVSLSMGPPVTADLQDNCRAICRPKCDGLANEVCTSLSNIVPVLNNLDFFSRTCRVRISAPCASLCINICSLDTLTPSTGGSPPPPPCMPY
jgi:hypothetical protein